MKTRHCIRLSNLEDQEQSAKDIRYKIKLEKDQSKDRNSLESNKTITEESLDSIKVIDSSKPLPRRVSSTFVNSNNQSDKQANKPVQYPYPNISNSLLRNKTMREDMPKDETQK